MSYLDDLSCELRVHGIGGRRRRRILAEADDHLRSDPEALERFGSAEDVANAFAAELGAYAARRAAVDAFAALGVAGTVYAVDFTSLAITARPSETFRSPLDIVALVLMVFAPQVAFVAGTLALVRGLRCRDRVLPTQELVVIRRRTGVALLFGLATMGALAVYAFEFRVSLAAWWTSLTFASTALGSVLLVAASFPAARAALLRPRVAGEPGDIFDDLGVARVRTGPWRFAGCVAIGVGGAVWLAGIVQGDPLDGLVRGVFEGLACFGGFAVLGRYLGLRR